MVVLISYAIHWLYPKETYETKTRQSRQSYLHQELQIRF